MEQYNDKEGDTATNKQTGERFVFRSGQWVPMPQEPSVGQRIYNAATNIPRSVLEYGKALAYPFMHPVETGRNIADVASGIAEQNRQLSPPELRGTAPAADTSKAKAVESYYKNRYGGLSNIARTAEQDPIGALTDLSAVLTLGGGGSELPGILGRTAQVSKTVGRAIDPLNIVAKTGSAVGKLGTESLGLSAGVGSKPIEEAYAAGKGGQRQREAFRANITKEASATDVVNEARQALSKMREERSNAYTSGMSAVNADPTILDMAPIVQKVNDVKNRGVYEGKVKNQSAANAWEEINNSVNEWLNDDPAKFHTPQGLDALKQRIGDIRDSQQFGTPSYNAAKSVYGVIRDQIAQQAPTYGKTMAAYEEASDALKELEGALSLGQKAQVDTGLRKLQSILRNNANTNYGRREELGNLLVSKGAETLYPALAGQALQSWTPRALSGQGAALGLGFAAAKNPLLLAALPLTSPRTIGEVSYAAGRVAGSPSQFAEMLSKYGDQLSQVNPTMAFTVDRAKKAIATGQKIDPIYARQLALQLSRIAEADKDQQ